jgi:hypothetical protein
MFNLKKRAVMRAHVFAAPVLILGALSACGGGSGGGDNAPPEPIANQPPVFSSAATATIVENSTAAAYQAVASDPNSDPLTYSIAGGADSARFTISATGQLSFVTPPNYDLPTDADGNNIYQVQIAVSDGKASTSLALSLTVTNSKEGVAVHRVANGFTNPVAMSPVSATSMLVAEKGGAIYLLNLQTGTKSLLIQIENVGTIGVTAMAAAPTFAANGTFFVMYTTQYGYLIINRYLRNPAGPTVPDNNGPLLGISAPQYSGGGWLGYDSSGILLAATGDAGGAVASLRNQYVFGDGSGAVFAIGTASLIAGTTRPANVIERRDADFAPDAGSIDHPSAITSGPGGTLYILDADGDVFRVDGS